MSVETINEDLASTKVGLDALFSEQAFLIDVASTLTERLARVTASITLLQDHQAKLISRAASL